jgi:hypothetical protein
MVWESDASNDEKNRGELQRASSACVDIPNQGAGKLSGKWVKVNESMSDLSRKYQKQITGRTGEAWLENGVKFDGVKNGRLIEVKGDYSNFIENGKFKRWFTGDQSLVDQARRQLEAAKGNPIDWYCINEPTKKAIKDLFDRNGIKGINFIVEPVK